jgi:cyd operon protein YbgT
MWYLAWILAASFAVAFAAWSAMRQETTPGK